MARHTVISLFDLTGESVQPWADAGYGCHIIDQQHKPLLTGAFLRENIQAHNIDLLHAEPEQILRALGIEDYRQIAFISAYPSCQNLACSGARWFKGKGLRALASGINMFATAADFCEYVNTFQATPYYIENPVSTISTYWRKPDYSFHPWQYSGLEPADCYTKKTCLWTGGGFNMPEPDCDPDCQPDDRIHKAAPGPERANFRSATPAGFARAVFMANANIQSINQTGESNMIDNYDLMSLICDAVAREQGISTDIGDPEFAKLYDNISQPILALLNARDERSL